MKMCNIKDQSIFELIKKKILFVDDGDSCDDFDACHQCKCLFHKSFLIQCNYKSSTMGLP
jgi:2-hydroxy-3-keto-5-methylthiopentenyl-1-phosphate phosphatase